LTVEIETATEIVCGDNFTNHFEKRSIVSASVHRVRNNI